MLEHAAATLRPEVRERALAAVAATRPRRHPRLVTIIAVILLVALLAAAVYATVHYLLIEGTLQFSDARIISLATGQVKLQTIRTRWLTDKGEMQWGTGVMPEGVDMDLSPESGDMLYVEKDGWPPARYEIWRAKRDGSQRVHLTEKAGLKGISCDPQWSPDGKMIAFVHSDPAEGQLPCEAGLHVWLMDADGSNAHRLTPEGSAPSRLEDWHPDGSHLLCSFDDVGAATMDLSGKIINVVPNLGWWPTYSPDGALIASTFHEDGEVNGQPGVWGRLVLTRADGSQPRVLVERFASDAEVDAYLMAREDAVPGVAPDPEVRATVQIHVAPQDAVWSPSGKMVAFVAVMSLEADGPYFKHQREVWICDVATKELTRMTHDDVAQHSLIWR